MELRVDPGGPGDGRTGPGRQAEFARIEPIDRDRHLDRHPDRERPPPLLVPRAPLADVQLGRVELGT